MRLVYIAHASFSRVADDEAHPDVQEIMAALEDEAYVEEDLTDAFFVTITESEAKAASLPRPSLDTNADLSTTGHRDAEQRPNHRMSIPPELESSSSAQTFPKRACRLIDAQFENMMLQYDDSFEEDDAVSRSDHDHDHDLSDDDDDDEAYFSDSVVGQVMQDYIVDDETYDFKKTSAKERAVHAVQEMDALRQALATVTTLPKTQEDSTLEDDFDSDSEQWLRPLPAKRWDIQIAAKGTTILPHEHPLITIDSLFAFYFSFFIHSLTRSFSHLFMCRNCRVWTYLCSDTDTRAKK